MRGLLADVNVQGHVLYLGQLFGALDLQPILTELQVDLVTFHDLGLPLDLDDRSLWDFCQDSRWVLLTENRNHDGPNSLQQTIADCWKPDRLPVLTLANKMRFERDREYAVRVAHDIAELLFEIWD